jgi:hypothetical protein
MPRSSRGGDRSTTSTPSFATGSGAEGRNLPARRIGCSKSGRNCAFARAARSSYDVINYCASELVHDLPRRPLVQYDFRSELAAVAEHGPPSDENRRKHARCGSISAPAHAHPNILSAAFVVAPVFNRQAGVWPVSASGGRLLDAASAGLQPASARRRPALPGRSRVREREKCG